VVIPVRHRQFWRSACIPTYSGLQSNMATKHIVASSVGDPDPDPHIFGPPDPDPLVRGTGADPDPVPDPSLFS
jgi:hypothetical protein